MRMRSFLIPGMVATVLGLFFHASLAAAGIDAVDEPEANPVYVRPARQPAPDTTEPDLQTKTGRRAVAPEAVGEDLPARAEPPAPAPSGRKAGNGPAAILAPVAAPPPVASAPRDAGTAVTATTAPSVSPPPPAPPPILLPKGTLQDLIAHFRARQQALLEQNPRRAEQETNALRDLKTELGFPDLDTVGEALAREGELRLQSHLTAPARRSAQLAVQLAPDLPAGYFLLGRAELKEAGWSALSEAGMASMQAIRAELSQPIAVRALLANMALSGIWAALAACSVVVLLLLLATLRYALHDFHHLFPRAASPLQTYLLGLTLLALPWLFHLGPFAIFSGFAAASWLYVGRQGRAVLLATLLLAAATPFLVGAVARVSAVSPLGLDLWSVERDLDSEQAASRLQTLAEDSKAGHAVLFALGHRAKRLGQLDDAEAYDRRALAVAPAGAPHVDIQNNLANVLLLKGDLKGAQALYESAIETDPGRAAFYFNLGQTFNRLLQLDQAQEAQRRALELNRELIEGHMGQDFHANAFLVDVDLPWSEIARAGMDDDISELGVRRQAEARLFGPLRAISIGVTVFVGLFLLLLTLLRPRLRPSASCEKCGRPVCNRCDPTLPDDRLCGQCVNVFLKRSAADPPARIRKEARVKAYQVLRVRVARMLSIALGAGGQVALGSPLVGAVVLFVLLFLLTNALGIFYPGLTSPFRPPFAGPLGAALALCSLLLLLPVYFLSVRDTFVRTR
jgi:tetratricopeptide (TPR) repeat protein